MRAFLPAALLLAAVCCLAEEGLASWYGGKFQGRRTASGEIFDTRLLTAAHRSLPFGTRLEVTNLENGKSVTVRVNDRGPFVAGRIVDLSLAAASAIGLTGRGVAPVRLQVLGSGEPPAADGQARTAARPVPASYCLQLGSFRNRANAEALRARLAAAGFPAVLEPVGGARGAEGGGGGGAGAGVIRVVLPGVGAAELSGLRARLAAAGWAEALVRVEP